MKMLRHDRDFWDLCVAMWRTRNLEAQVLINRMPKSALDGLKRSARIKRIYQCSLQDEFEDLSGQRQALAVFQAATVPLREAPQPMVSEAWKTACAFFKQAFQVDRFYSLPSYLFDSAAQAIDHQASERLLRTGCDPVAEARLVCALDPLPVDMASLAQTSFFVVKACAPEKRTHVPLCHLDVSRTTVHVGKCRACANADTGEVDVELESAALTVLDTLSLSYNMLDVLQTLHHWKRREFVPTFKLLRPLALESTPSPRVELQPALCDGGVVAPDPGSAIVPAPAASADSDVVALLRLCASRSAWVGSDVRVPLQDVSSHGAVQLLQECGAVVLHEGPDRGSVQLERERVAWTATARLAADETLLRQPRQDIPWQKRSKLDFILQLELEGWSRGPQPVEDWDPEGLQVYDQSMKRPLSYYASLVHRFDVLERGAQAIAHDRMDAYYKCLLGLPRLKLQVMLQLEDGPMDNSWYMEHAKGVKPIQDDDGTDVEPEPDLLAIADHNAAPDTIDTVTRWTRVQCDVGEGTPVVKVYFDHASKASEQKGWTPCLPTNACRWHVRYIFGASQMTYCANMYAWHEGHRRPEVSGKQAHMAYVPDDATVRQIRAKLRIFPF